MNGFTEPVNAADYTGSALDLLLLQGTLTSSVT
jgi:hypothetical protein